MSATVVEVALAAGVSKSTAARVLSGHPAVSASARQRVLSAAERLGYRTNPLASALRAGHTRLVGLVVTNLLNSSIQAITEIVQTRLHDHGYQVLLGVTGGDPDREREIVEALRDNRVAGILLMGTSDNAEWVNDVHAAGTPVVNLIRRPDKTQLMSVLPDNYDGAYQAARHLIDQGHRAIAYIGGPGRVASGRERYAGYRSALDEEGIANNSRLELRGEFTPEFGRQATRKLLDGTHPFTALLVTNHEAIFGVLPALQERRVSIPSRLSLIGFEDVPWFESWTPPITVVDINPRALGEQAVDSLLSQITGPDDDRSNAVRPGATLICRGSVSTPKTSPSRTPAH